MRASVALALLLLGVAILPGPIEALPLDAYKLTPHNPIVIEGDADWCNHVNGLGYDDDGVDCRNGDGTPLRPYTIRGWRINLAAFPPGTAAITLRNTTKAWAIRDNVLLDTSRGHARDGIVLVGASDSKGLIEHNQLEGLRNGLVAREWFASERCTLPGGGAGLCLWRRISAPTVEFNQFTDITNGFINGPQLGLPLNEASGTIRMNNFDRTADFAYVEVLPTKWKPTLTENWWGNPLGPNFAPEGKTAGSGRYWAQCAAGTAQPLGVPAPCVTPWLPAANPTAGALLMG